MFGIRVIESRYFKYDEQIDTDKYCKCHRLPRSGNVRGHVTSLNSGEITDNLQNGIQDLYETRQRHTVTIDN